jgi:LysR family hydrogen peroxide-inducible transcriptional activator
MAITMRQIIYFEALAETGHFGRAAERVHISQPALSAQIAQLERQLGCQLIERRKSGLVLTERGRAALMSFRKILDALRQLEAEASSGRGFFGGTLRLGIIPTIAPYLLPAFVPDLRIEHPDLRLEVRETTTDALVAHLGSGDIDAMVAAAPLGGSGIVSEALFEDPFHIAVAENEADVLASPVNEAALAIERLLLLEEGHCLRDQALDLCGVPRERKLLNFGATSLTTLLQMVEHGMGMTLVPQIAIEAECKSERIRVVPFADPVPSRSIRLFWRTSLASSNDMLALAVLLRKAGELVLARALR